MQLTPVQKREINKFIAIHCPKSADAFEHLLATPDAAYIMRALIAFAVYSPELSLRNGHADEKFEQLRWPDSLRASINQLRSGVDTVTRASHDSMCSLQDIVRDMGETMLNILMSVKNPNLIKKLPYYCDKMKILLMKSFGISEKIYQDICEQLEVSEELIGAAVAARGREEKREKECVKMLTGMNETKRERQLEMHRKDEEYRKQKENKENALKLRNEAVERCSSFWTILSARASDSLVPLAAAGGTALTTGLVVAAGANPLTIIPTVLTGLAAVAKQWHDDKKDKTKTAMQQLNKNVEDARIHFKEEQERADAKQKEAEEANEKYLEVVIAITKLNLEHVDLNELIKYLKTFNIALGKASDAWKDWSQFWHKMCEKINHVFIQNVSDFIQSANDGVETPELEADIHRYASRICVFESILMQEAELYKTISSIFISPSLRNTNIYILSKEEAKRILESVNVAKFRAGVKAEIDAHNQRLPGEVMQSLIEKGYDLNDAFH